jgi:hypothetical protein
MHRENAEREGNDSLESKDDSQHYESDGCCGGILRSNIILRRTAMCGCTGNLCAGSADAADQ